MFPFVVPKGAALTLKGITTVNASKDMGRALKMIESYAEVQLSENTIYMLCNQNNTLEGGKSLL